MSEETVRIIVVALLGAGGATFVGTIFKSIIAWRESADSLEERAVMRLEKFEYDCRKQLADERKWSAHWYRVAGILQHTLDKHGIDQPKLPNPPNGNGIEKPKISEKDCPDGNC